MLQLLEFSCMEHAIPNGEIQPAAESHLMRTKHWPDLVFDHPARGFVGFGLNATEYPLETSLVGKIGGVL